MIRFGSPTLRVARGIKRKKLRGGDVPPVIGRVRVLVHNEINNRLLELPRTLFPLRAPGVGKFVSLRDGTYAVTSLVGCIGPLQMICVRLLLDRKGSIVLCPLSEQWSLLICLSFAKHTFAIKNSDVYDAALRTRGDPRVLALSCARTLFPLCQDCTSLVKS